MKIRAPIEKSFIRSAKISETQFTSFGIFSMTTLHLHMHSSWIHISKSFFQFPLISPWIPLIVRAQSSLNNNIFPISLPY
ncbi:High-affinity nitrate transporter 2.2 -like protein [Gossypium arboreum]|uniref:High-affinity nitrate transporter 2.2-like protein n=1 Tax=Gossypium arboreum TaxID=29729 RepID=A0A0B0PIQ5_GOSAR|nr:High-affinity nitrate transporter 2.2 -like protein [Gossypium arboreum]